MYRLEYMYMPKGEMRSQDFSVFEDLEDALFEQVELCCKTGLVSNMEEAYSLASMCVKPETKTHENEMSLYNKNNGNAPVFSARWCKA